MTEYKAFVKRPGGVKKFLYTGTGKEGAEEEQWTFTPKVQDNKPTGIPVDLNDVWSIQKNVSLKGLAPPAADRLNHNVNKGFYSRHGGMKDGGRNAKPPEKTDVGSAWAPARGSGFSYSHTVNNMGDDDSNSSASSRTGRDRRSIPGPRRVDRNDF